MAASPPIRTPTPICSGQNWEAHSACTVRHSALLTRRRSVSLTGNGPDAPVLLGNKACKRAPELSEGQGELHLWQDVPRPSPRATTSSLCAVDKVSLMSRAKLRIASRTASLVNLATAAGWGGPSQSGQDPGLVGVALARLPRLPAKRQRRGLS